VATQSVHGLYRSLVENRITRRRFTEVAAAMGVSGLSASLFLRAADARLQAEDPPTVVTGDGSLFAGQEITVQIIDASIKLPIEEAREEFEAATGAALSIVVDPVADAYTRLLEDASDGTNAIDGSIIGMWSLGELVELGLVRPIDDFLADTSGTFPAINPDDELAGVRALRSYDGQRYVIPYDCDGQCLYYRRDVLTNPVWMDQYQSATGSELSVPQTWDEMVQIATFFNGQDFDDQGAPGHGVSLPLRAGGQSVFHYLSLSAPYLVGPENTQLYWFNPANMDPLVQSAGHVRAMQTYLDLSRTGPEAQLDWAVAEAWDYFLEGNAIFTFSWSDVLPLAIEQEKPTRGKIGAARLPGTMAYVNPLTGEEYTTAEVNFVGNTTGGSWAPVIMQATDHPEACYYFFAMLATEARQRFFAGRVSDGIDPGRWSQLPPEAVEGGTGNIEAYTSQGFTAEGAIEFCKAYFDTFNNPLQLPYLRIPGTTDYWSALDVHLYEVVSGGDTPQGACVSSANDWREITESRGIDGQLGSYTRSLGL
jgi:multiple sugar transport system substrate-binding protein